jgi:hypothetical protein
MNENGQTKAPTKTDASKKRMLAALRKSLGIVSSACKKAKVSRSTHYEWMKEDEVYSAAVAELRDEALDFVESALMRSVADGNVPAQIFFLKCKGQGRGYIEKQQVEHSGGIDLGSKPLTPERKAEILNDVK